MPGPDDTPLPVAVFTGAAGGIGLACARRLAGGRPTVLADLDPARTETAAASLRAQGVHAIAVPCDVTDPDSVAALAARVADLGPLGVLVHSAGVAPPLVTDPHRILEVNLAGAARVLDAFEPFVGPGSVAICVASLAGHRRGMLPFDALLDEPLVPDLLERLEAAAGQPLPALAAYSASKRGVIRLCARRAAAWGGRGGRVLSLSPGLVADTSIGAAAASIHAGAYAAQSALGRAGASADVADIAAHLASPECAYLTGCDVLADGGVLAAIHHHGAPAAAAAWHAGGLDAPPAFSSHATDPLQKETP
ncbi:MAG: family oxidoreductase [Solirubrobacterales bacterium]|nr:family oxidoreductase [Solirubrobacterales bacterium]